MFSFALLTVSGIGIFSTGSAETALNFRRDAYLDQSQYPEGTWAPIPDEGGRVQIVSDIEKNLNVSYPLTVDLGNYKMKLDSKQYPDNVPSDGLDWVLSWYNEVSGSLLTTFHMHKDSKLDSVSKLVVTDATGLKLVDEPSLNIDKKTSGVQVTYVTTKNNYKNIVVHFHNYGSNDHTIDQISLNSGLYTFDGFKIRNGEHVVKVYDISEFSFTETSVWTIVVSWDDNSNKVGYGGRLIKELYPIEDWPKSEQCPFPVDGANEDNFNELRDDLHLNTHYFGGKCDADKEDIFMAAADSNGEWYVLPSRDHFTEDKDIPDGSYPGIAAAFLGDESDSSVEASWDVWSRVLEANKNYNEYAHYCGGHSNHLNGIFSGITDIQGMDFYVGACAPHITTWASTMRIEGAYDYLHTARENQKPSPTWLYSQGWCSDCWSVKDQNPGEALVQLASVVAAGGKGLMLFQSDLKLQGSESWKTGSNFLNSVSLIKEFLRTSDIEGARYSTSAEHAITEVLYGPSELLFIAISTDASGYNAQTCAVSGSHWTFKEQTISKSEIEIPGDLVNEASASGKSPSDYFKAVEVANGSYKENPDDVEMEITDSQWKITSLKLGSSSTTARMFMLVPK